MYFEIYSIKGGLIGGPQWRWRLKAGNHQILASGEGYWNKADCLHVIALIQSTNLGTPIHEVAA
jgi:uncharacterized protein YegP (UPF0339 family)